MKLFSAILRLLCGAILVGFTVIKYHEFSDPLGHGATTQLFGHPVSPKALLILLVASGSVGVVSIILGLLTLRKRG